AFAHSPVVIETRVEAGRVSDRRAGVLVLELEELRGRRPIGRAFVGDFRRAWQRLADGWTGVPFEDIDARRELALITLSRLLFLAFVQARGWLDGRMHYLNEEAARVSAKGEVSVFKGLLTPLFFGVLNTPVDERSPRALELGEIPYLNGGLFSEDPIEQRFRDRDVANPVLLEIFEEVFGKYVFCGSEAELQTRFSVDGDAEVRGAIDPAMLGHVFESLMADSERGESGSFYTPRHVVARIVREALVVYCADVLERHAHRTHVPSLTNGKLRQALEAVFESGEVERLSVEEARVLDRALARVRVLDPAAGSGAFVIGAFE